MPRRCAFGCSSNSTSLHRFPDANKDPERFKTWVSLVDKTLATVSDFDYYKKKMVCDIHFTARDKNRNNRLNALAVPSLHLHGEIVESPVERASSPTASPNISRPTISQSAEESCPQLKHVPPTADCVMLEHNYSVRRTNNGDECINASSESPDLISELPDIQDTPEYTYTILYEVDPGRTTLELVSSDLFKNNEEDYDNQAVTKVSIGTNTDEVKKYGVNLDEVNKCYRLGLSIGKALSAMTKERRQNCMQQIFQCFEKDELRF